MWRPGRRSRALLAVVAAVTLSTAAMLASGPRGAIAGLSTDVLFWLRDRTFGQRQPASASPVALVLIDEASYDAYDPLPKDFWSPEFAAAIAAIDNAGAKLIGFDILLPLSISRAAADLGNTGIPETYDAAFTQALGHAGALGKLVMIKAASGAKVIMPDMGELMVAGGDGNARFATTLPDDDGIERHQGILARSPGAPPHDELAFAGELARRAGWKPDRQEIALNFDGGYPFETYSFSDIVACAEQGKADFFAHHFHDRIVLIATGNPVEDRHLTSRRLINQPEIMTGERCTPGTVPQSNVTLSTIPGVFIHATAIDNLLHHDLLTELAPWLRVATVATFAAAGATIKMLMPLAWSWGGLLALLACIVAGATMMFHLNLDVPLIESIGAATLSFVLMLGYRLVAIETDRRRIRAMFGMYLAPSVVDRMVAAERLPERGGERRQMTFFFSDISGFTTLTETADPHVLSPTLNTYFDGVCDAVEREGGVVIEFLGDGVQAMFGAPAEMPDHAARAIAAARTVDQFSELFRSTGTPRELGFGHTRLGVHTGDALVGNIGASSRMKYAALGDVVNATSRLEGLNKYFGTRICVSQEAIDASKEPDVRPLGDFLVVGKSLPITVYEVLLPGESEHPWMIRYMEAYRRLTVGDPSAIELLKALAEERSADNCIRFHLDRALQGELSTLIRMTAK